MKWHSVSGTHHLIPDYLLMWQMLNVHSSCYASLCHPYFPSLLPGQVRTRDNIVQKEFACVEFHNRGTTYFSYSSLYELIIYKSECFWRNPEVQVAHSYL